VPFLFTVIAILLYEYFSYPELVMLDGPGSVFILPMISPENTIASDQRYSAERFLEIEEGASEQDTKSRIGLPFSTKKVANSIYWYYSRSATSDSYRMRIVVFVDGRVVQTITGYYMDL
jgi:hypothetical protein